MIKLEKDLRIRTVSGNWQIEKYIKDSENPETKEMEEVWKNQTGFFPTMESVLKSYINYKVSLKTSSDKYFSITEVLREIAETKRLIEDSLK